MPNTLAHIGIQTLVTRGVLRDADIKWIWAACVMPDLPWIGQRVGLALVPGTPAVDLRLYAIVQSSLLFCLVLSGALASFSRRPGRSFGILAGGCLLHLLLDALQTKWANGVLLFTPIHWELLNLGLFWPEDWRTLALTGLGLVVALTAVRRLPKTGADLCWPRGRGLAAVAVLGALYLAGPFQLMPYAEAADLHFAGTLRDGADRIGQPVGFDRNRVEVTDGTARLRAWNGEVFTLTGEEHFESGTVSVLGRFYDAQTVEVVAIHRHSASLREYASYLGLGAVLLWWAFCLFAPRAR